MSRNPRRQLLALRFGVLVLMNYGRLKFLKDTIYFEAESEDLSKYKCTRLTKKILAMSAESA